MASRTKLATDGATLSIYVSWRASESVVRRTSGSIFRANGRRRCPAAPRELEVLALLAEGASNKVIARRLGISVHTAKFHVASLLDKLDAIGRTDAVAHAARRGVINL